LSGRGRWLRRLSVVVWVLSVGVAQARLTGRVEGGDCVRGGRERRSELA
jgi:hypothetical protein